MIRPVRADGTIDTGGAFAPIRRQRVVERIAGAAMQRIVLLIAPAGYGKSVALRQYLAGRTDDYVRFDVQADHTGLLGFLRGFSEALGAVAPQARDSLAGAYERNAASSNAGVDLALWMHSHLRSYRGCIAIDDLHVAQDDREVTKFLTSLIERTKDRVQWVIASRASTGLPIGTWLAYGESDLAVDEHDLRFTQEEARDAARAFRLAVRDDELYDLVQLTDGWATAMSFALRTSTRSVDIRAISSTTREMVYHYLAEQVYASLSDDERAFLEAATQLQRIDVRVLVAAGFDQAAALIERLQSRVAFLQEEDAEPGVYRCQELFREFIARQLELQGHNRASELRRTLAKVLEDLGMFAQAMRMYAAAADRDAVRRLLCAHGLNLVARGSADVVAQALTLCDDESEPEIATVRGLLEYAQGHADEAERLLLRAQRSTSKPELRTFLALRIGRWRINRGADARPVLQGLLDDADVPYSGKLEASSMLAVTSVRAGEGDLARNYATFVLGRLEELTDRELRAKLCQRVGATFLELNDFDYAERLLEEASKLASDAGIWSLASAAFQARGNLMISARNDTASALWFSQQAAMAAEKAGDIFDLRSALLQMLSVETRRGNAERAASIERQLGDLGGGDAMRWPYIVSSQAHRSFWAGDFGNAHRLFGSVLDRQAHALDRAFVRSVYALALALDGRSSDSQKAVDTTMAAIDDPKLFPEGYDSVPLETATLFCGLAEAVCGRHTRSQKLLKRDAHSGHAVVAHLRESAAQLARAAKSRSYACDGLSHHYEMMAAQGYGMYARALEQVELAITRSQVLEVQEIRLTPQEVRIVRLLAEGLAPKDIAAELGRSVFTVQTHIQNVIEKLGCHGRTEAIAAAKKLGVL